MEATLINISPVVKTDTYTVSTSDMNSENKNTYIIINGSVYSES